MGCGWVGSVEKRLGFGNVNMIHEKNIYTPISKHASFQAKGKNKISQTFPLLVGVQVYSLIYSKAD